MSTEPTTTPVTLYERMFVCKGQRMRVLSIATSIVAWALLAGCGGDDSSTPATESEAEADRADVEVIEDWSSTLSEGDVEGAADYFAIPSIAQNGLLIEIESREDAIEFNESLPCGAEVISARSQGEFTTATFRLSERPGGGCGPGAGGTASTSFVIEDGEIVEWRRVDDAAPGGGGDGGDLT
jgi:hypothetical protein